VDVALTCPGCGAATLGDERFCEACGRELPHAVPPATALPPPAPGASVTDLRVVDTDLDASPSSCVSCTAGHYADGYCDQCGAAVPKIRDHFADLPAPWVAAVCDRGIRHARNEDAMAVAASAVDAEGGGRAVLVVCDGVSSAPRSEIASLAAARAARNALVAGCDLTAAGAAAQFQASGGRSGPHDVPTMAITMAAIAAAADAANASHPPAELADPDFAGSACTLVMAVVEGAPNGGVRVNAGWVGDSRAYWLPDDDAATALQLTIDDSWAAEAIAHGVPREDAERMPQAHAITRWLGPDSPDPMPKRSTVDVVEPGWVLVCSDGLWNYTSPADRLAALVRRLSSPSADPATGAPAGDSAATAGTSSSITPLVLADRLVAWATEQGGHDNITVALARVSGTGTVSTGTASIGTASTGTD
jgi:serine/threonine protein phosphatase PrpC